MAYKVLSLVFAVFYLANVRAQNNCTSQGISETVTVQFGTSHVNSTIGNRDGLLLLSCEIELMPSSAITSYRWYHRGEELEDQSFRSQQLRIEMFQDSNSGGYQCLGISVVCKTSRSSVFTVQLAPLVTIANENPLRVSEGESTVLNCMATGWPAPSIQWYRIANGRQTLPIGREYTIMPVVTSDAGRYECQANNEAGSSSFIIAVVVLQSTDPPEVTDPPGTSTGVVNIPTEVMLPTNGTSPTGFYIAIGVTAGVSLILGCVSLLCCIIAVYIDCCREPKYEDVYEEETEMNAATEQKTNVSREQDGKLLSVDATTLAKEEERVVIEGEEFAAMEPPLETVEEEMLERSPSEIGAIV